jgi:S1-C subfamily serine protease
MQNSPAALSGLRPGDIILDVNKVKVSSVQEALKNLKNGLNVLRVSRGDTVTLVFIDSK